MKRDLVRDGGEKLDIAVGVSIGILVILDNEYADGSVRCF